MLVLASNSPRRKQLLALGGWKFQVHPAEIDESPLPEEDPQDYVLRMAEEKARRVAQELEKSICQEAVIIAADTTVVDTVYEQGEPRPIILGKPADAREAEAMLRRLRGRTHQVLTGLAVLRGVDGEMLHDVCVTDVPMRNYSDEEMQAYIASGDPLDKAGAYAIQNAAFHPVEGLTGCFANVMGLPLCHVTRLLAYFDIFPEREIPQACQEMLGVTCSIYEQAINPYPGKGSASV